MVFADGTSFTGRWNGGAWLQSAADPARCRLRGGGLARAVAGEAAGFNIQVGNACHHYNWAARGKPMRGQLWFSLPSLICCLLGQPRGLCLVIFACPPAQPPCPLLFQQARDEDNNPRLSGGDAFTVALLAENPNKAGQLELPERVAPGGASGPLVAVAPAAISRPTEGVIGGADEAGPAAAGPALAVVGAGDVKDMEDGTYEVLYRLEKAGRYMLAVTDGM
jgi:hypothetical protein